MATAIQTKYENQLPKPNRLTFESVIGYVGAGASIVGLLAAPFVLQNPSLLTLLYLSSLSLLVFFLFAYAYVVNRRKLHRYAQSVIHVHFLNHVIRDSLRAPSDSKIKDVTVKLLGAIANCYSILTAKTCRAYIIELTEARELKIFATDPISEAMDKRHLGAAKLMENSAFNDLWFGKNGCSRFFLSNNLIRKWKRRQFETSAFEHFGKPEIRSALGIEYVANWHLPYRSILILPIRYISEFSPPADSGKHENWDYWGFLCVDCNTKNSFDSRYSPELGGAFADAFYTLFSGYAAYANVAALTPPATHQ